jgi:8-oxo-dGTP diphosphatase
LEIAKVQLSQGEKVTGAKPAVSVAVVDERDGRGRVLLVLRANAPARGLYAFPGGRVEAGESLEAAALRELNEETGLIGANPVPLASFDLKTHDAAGRLTNWFELTVFSARLRDDSPLQPIASDDAAAAAWFDGPALVGLPMPDSVRDCLILLGFLGPQFEATPAEDSERRP